MVIFNTDVFLSIYELISRSFKHMKNRFPLSTFGSQKSDKIIELIDIESTCSAGLEKSVA